MRVVNELKATYVGSWPWLFSSRCGVFGRLLQSERVCGLVVTPQVAAMQRHVRFRNKTAKVRRGEEGANDRKLKPD